MIMDMQRKEVEELDYLIKPNAGGFGAGIEKRTAQRMTNLSNKRVLSNS